MKIEHELVSLPYLLAKLKASLSEFGSDMIDIEDGAFLETIGASFEFCLERLRLLIKLLTWLSVAVLKFVEKRLQYVICN